MTIPQKGSRLITVDGVEYRWYIRRKPTYVQEIFGGGLTVAVERVSTEHTNKLIIRTLHDRPDSLGQNPAVIHPGDVAAAIQAALEAGWDPLAGKGTFEYTIPV